MNPSQLFSLTTAAATDERLFDSELLFALEEGKCRIISMFISGSRL